MKENFDKKVVRVIGIICRMVSMCGVYGPVLILLGAIFEFKILKIIGIFMSSISGIIASWVLKKMYDGSIEFIEEISRK